MPDGKAPMKTPVPALNNMRRTIESYEA